MYIDRHRYKTSPPATDMQKDPQTPSLGLPETPSSIGARHGIALWGSPGSLGGYTDFLK